MSQEASLAGQTLDTIKRAGFDRAACRVSNDELHELQAETGEINLFRTSFETDIALIGIKDERRASLSVNKTDEATIGQAVTDLRTMAEGANPDPAYDIASAQPHESFEGGIEKPDYDAMYDRVVDLQKYAHATYPTLNIRAISVTFVRRRSCYANSNDVEFRTSRGLYQVGLQFSSRDGSNTSSMMYTGYSTYDLDTPIEQATNVDQLLRQSTEQVTTQNIPGKFKGDMIIAPNCLTDFTGFLTARISDGAMISGTSVYADKLGQQVASPQLTIRSMPLSDELTGGYWVTGDGFKADNLTVVNKGVLDSYLLGLYGANKLGMARAVNSGGAWVIDAGDVSYDDMVAGVEEGILITRFSGGRPNDRGDFSGIAKNSYYVKDGKVQFPIKETTVSGNMVDLLQSVGAVSSERVNFGGSLLPWVRVSGITAS